MSVDVGVVIPVFNGARYLGAAIESLLGQTQPPQIIVVVDDGSTDGSLNVARQYGPKVACLQQDHGGAAAARNTGQKILQTSMLAFLDADDVWEPRKLERQVSILAAAPNPSMVFGHLEQFISPDLTPQEQMQLRCDAGSVPGYCCSTMLMQNSDFTKLGGFNPELRIAEFMEWFARAKLARLTPIMMPETVSRRRLHLTNTGRLASHPREGFARAMKAVLDLRRANS